MMRADCSNSEIAIRQLQIWLKGLAGTISDMPEVDVTGVFDEDTERAVRRFQIYSGLTPSGAVDYNTWVKIKTEYKRARKK